ncbi:hypothetical protein [Nonomuraea longicatena]|uniref:Uncharacterized protein n=1 Tax=Nonomuraea longicatena TaxID=83682 RepID=A0ABN1QQW6_9ACTN
MGKKTTAVEYADFAEYDRRQRGIERHVLTAFLGGLAVGMIGMLVSAKGPELLWELYDPYAYLAAAIAVGATATGFGWALLTTFLAAVSSLVAAMGTSALQGRLHAETVGSGATELNVLLVLLVALGLLSYLTRHPGLWGDLAAGLVGAMLIADVIDRSNPGFLDYEPGFWPVPALVIGTLSVAGVFLLRRRLLARLRSLAVTATLSAPLALAVL